MECSIRIFALVLFSILTTDVFHCLQLTTDNISVEYDKDVTSNTTNVQLKCNYDLDGDSLYSIKWYKDRREFYRFHPDEKPSATTFPVNGVNVYKEKSNSFVVYLKSIDESSSGSYRCEVFAGEPSYQFAAQEVVLAI